MKRYSNDWVKAILFFTSVQQRAWPPERRMGRDASSGRNADQSVAATTGGGVKFRLSSVDVGSEKSLVYYSDGVWDLLHMAVRSRFSGRASAEEAAPRYTRLRSSEVHTGAKAPGSKEGYEGRPSRLGDKTCGWGDLTNGSLGTLRRVALLHNQITRTATSAATPRLGSIPYGWCATHRPCALSRATFHVSILDRAYVLTAEALSGCARGNRDSPSSSRRADRVGHLTPVHRLMHGEG
jgi:hypothetical protein